jgi:hypothetical protein
MGYPGQVVRMTVRRAGTRNLWTTAAALQAPAAGPQGPVASTPIVLRRQIDQFCRW